jgi:hypothetical protein
MNKLIYIQVLWWNFLMLRQVKVQHKNFYVFILFFLSFDPNNNGFVNKLDETEDQFGWEKREDRYNYDFSSSISINDE